MFGYLEEREREKKIGRWNNTLIISLQWSIVTVNIKKFLRRKMRRDYNVLSVQFKAWKANTDNGQILEFVSI